MRKILACKSELNLKMMLEGGQSFRWKETALGEWTGVMSNFLWVIKQYDKHIEYETFKDELATTKENRVPEKCEYSQSELTNLDNVLKNYLRLHDNVNQYYEDWSKKDSNFNKIANDFSGIRILNQEPTENLFSFICSSNNNIKRITGMVNKLCELYGTKVAHLNGIDYYNFPTVNALSQPSVEMDLRNAGFGYRAKFISESAKLLCEWGGEKFLNTLKSEKYNTAKVTLMKLPGIGAKVADCICLMSLGHLDAVPVDTHVFKIASEIYLPHLRKAKSVTGKIYDEIGDHFRQLYGPQAGWAHAVLFCADLKMFGNDKKRKATVNKVDHTKQPELVDQTRYVDNMEIENGTIICTREDLNLRITLNSGQSYRWKELKTDIWRGVFKSRVWTIHQYDDRIDFTSVRYIEYEPPDKKGTLQQGRGNAKQLLYEYFRLDFNLKDHYLRWATVDKHFNEISTSFCGLRMIRQDIVENLFAFICSSNNTIHRMLKMVEKLCELYGEEIAKVDGVVYNDFPSVNKLAAENVETDLRQANFGFRAAYIQKSARQIVEQGGDSWFNKLCQLPYEAAKNDLMQLPGIGAKVADCICLTALDHLNTVPVDTHVYQIATKYYLPHLKKNSKSNSISTTAYKEIGDCFRKIFGDYTGWAHTVLFCSDLRQHSDLKQVKK